MRPPELDQAVNTYIRSRINYLRGESIFREDVIRKITFEIRDEMVTKLEIKLVTNESQPERALLEDTMFSLKAFKGSKHWFHNFMDRNHLASFKPRRKNIMHEAKFVEDARSRLRQIVCTTSPTDLINTDEVAVLYRSLPSRTVGTTDRASSYTRIKDRLTAVLTVFPDGVKAPLVIIGKSKRPKSILKRFDPTRDLGIYYYNQSHAWNTQYLWEKQVTALHKAAATQGRKVLHLVDNCSAHAIDYSSFKNVETQFLPPNLTSVVQPVDASIGRFFKAAFRRLLVNHVLEYVNVQMAKPPECRESFKLSKTVTIYDAVCMMATAWNLVPTKVVINGWLSCDILASYQDRELRAALLSATDCGKSAKLPHSGTPLQIQNTLSEHRSREAKRQGADYLKYLENTTVQSDVDCTNHNITQPEWLDGDMKHLADDLRGLENCSVIDNLDVSELSSFFNAEQEEDTSHPIEGNSIHDVVSG